MREAREEKRRGSLGPLDTGASRRTPRRTASIVERSSFESPIDIPVRTQSMERDPTYDLIVLKAKPD
jgi:hypothetical protein